MSKDKRAFGTLSHRSKRMLYECIFVIILVVVLCISFLADISIITLPSWLSHQFSDVEGLLLTLFTVQASISTLGIALVSIITGITSETIYGISISRYITKIKPVFFTHNRLIISNLLIIMANYIAISFMCFNVSVAFFSASILITILLAAEVFIIFLGKDAIALEIQHYILENYSTTILNDLSKEILKSIEIGSSFVTKQDCNMLLEILRSEATKTDFTSSEITDHISNIVSDSFEKITYLHNSSKSSDFLLFICNLYDVANERESAPLRLQIWPQIDESFFRALGDLQFEQLRDEYPHLKLHSRVYKNLVGAPADDIKTSSLSRYMGWVYYALFSDSRDFLEKESSRLKESLFRHAYFYLVGNKAFSPELKEASLIDFCYLNKAAIDLGDIQTLTKQYFNHFKYSNHDSEDVSCLISIIYLYYLSCREHAVKGKALQQNAQELLDKNKGIISTFLNHNLSLLTVTSSYYSFIQSLLNRWEYMEEENAKWMIIDSVVADFFILTGLFRYWDRKSILDIVNVIIPESMFSFYSRYFPDSEFKSLRSMASEFVKLFFPYIPEEMVLEKLYLLKDIFDEKYKTEAIMEGTENSITPEQLEKLSADVIAEMDSIVGRYPLLKSFGYYEETDTIIEKNNILLANIMIPNFLLQDNDYMRFLRDHLQYRALSVFFGSFKENITIKSLDYECANKQEALIKLLQESGVNADLIASSRDVFWEEREKTLLKDYTEKMSKAKLPDNANSCYLLNSKLVRFLLHDIEVKFEDLTWEEIEQDCHKTDDGKYEFNVTNNLYIPFEKKELQKHYAKTRKKLLVYGSVKYKQPSQKIGVGIEITYK